MNEQTQITQSKERVNKILKIIDHPNPKQLRIDNADIYPNNLICFIKFKIFKKNKIQSIFGTGCLISQTYVLTAAHNIQKVLLEYTMLNNAEYTIQGYVKQGLHEGKYISKYSIDLNKTKISKSYLSKFVSNQLVIEENTIKSQDCDYALLYVSHLEGEKQQYAKFPPIVGLKQTQNKDIQQVSLYGFAFEVNKNTFKSQDKNAKVTSSIFMQSMYGGTDRIVQYTVKNINYEIPTDKGVSGGPIIVSLSQPSIIGIHKCMIRKSQSKKAANAGVSALLMMQQINDWGHQLIKRPFVFTKATLALRNKTNIGKNNIFSLRINNNLDDIDMHVINGFDLSAVKKIILSGNKIGDEGLRIFLKRDYPNLQSLFLSENEIHSLNRISIEGWSHIKSVKNLSLSVNYLNELPEGIHHLLALQKLHLIYNNFSSIPKILYDLNNERHLVVSLYQNKIKINEQSQIKESLKTKNIEVILNKFQK